MIFRTPDRLVITADLALCDKYCNAASDAQQLGLLTLSKSTQLFVLPSPQCSTRPDVSGMPLQFSRLTFCVITMRMSL